MGTTSGSKERAKVKKVAAATAAAAETEYENDNDEKAEQDEGDEEEEGAPHPGGLQALIAAHQPAAAPAQENEVEAVEEGEDEEEN